MHQFLEYITSLFFTDMFVRIMNVFAARQPLSLDQDSSVFGDQQLTLELKVTFA